MEEKKFTARLRNIEEVKFPIVKAAFQGKEGNVYIGLMMVDTGSANCILSKSVLQLIDKEGLQLKDKKMNIRSVQSRGTICQGYNFTFKMCNGKFSDVFYVNEEFDFNEFIDGFIGIIGHEFLRKHKLVLDYPSQTLHASDGQLDISSDNIDFFFPMEFGLKNYNIPVVGLVNGDKEYVMVTDSGANNTVLTKHVLDESGFKSGKIESRGSVMGFSNEALESSIQSVDLCLLSIGGTEENPKICRYSDNLQIVDKYLHIMDGLKDSEGRELLPISGLLSSQFMLNHKWILDFGLGVIYSRKSA